MKRRPFVLECWLAALCIAMAGDVFAQPLGVADTGQPGDRMIQEYLARVTAEVESGMEADLKSLEEWQARREQYRQEYLYMLGLWPLPEKTPLNARVTGHVDGEGYTVDLLHYQSRPGLYVTANLYRPRETRPGERLPAVLYVCGHSNRGRNGNKTAYQPHGIWFARHGYVCLVVDSLQLGEIAAIHHGTYRENRWWWHSRGYTPAGVECWNGVRGIDYLVSRDDVDPQRLAVTGISGGGAATFWVAAADERVKVAVPVSGMADLESYIPNRVINGHCDCMFLHNTFAWPWTRIAGLIAPRPMLFVNSDKDAIFPMDANERVINRLERLYSLYGEGDKVDAVVSVGGHAYRRDIRQAAFRFINTHVKNDPRPISDSEVDLSSEGRDPRSYPIQPERLRVFPEDGDIPRDELNTTIDRVFVPLAEVKPPATGEFDTWKTRLMGELRRVAFRALPERVPAAIPSERSDARGRFDSEPGIYFHMRHLAGQDGKMKRTLLVVSLDDNAAEQSLAWLKGIAERDDAVVVCEPRGIGQSRWTMKNPPNTIARSHVLVGRTVDTGRLWDVASAGRYLAQPRQTESGTVDLPVHIAGKGAAGLVGAYAALLEPEIESVTLFDPPMSHMNDTAPQFLNLLRVCDVPQMLGMLAPRPLRIVTGTKQNRDALDIVRECYRAAGAAEKLQIEER
jgi:dienelactone hydrolase